MNPYTTLIEVEPGELARRLSKRMKVREVSVRRLAKDSEVDKETISLWKRGKRKRVYVEAVRKVAEQLELSAEDLLGIALPGAPPASSHDDLLRRVVELEKDVIPKLVSLIAEARGAAR